MNSALLTVNEAATRLRLTKHTIRSWIAQRRIGIVRLGRSVRVPVSEIESLLELGFRPAKRRE